MKLPRCIPSRGCVRVLAAAAVVCSAALFFGLALDQVVLFSGIFFWAMVGWVLADYCLHAAAGFKLAVRRQIPDALALGVEHTAAITLENTGRWPRRMVLFDDVDPNIETRGMPVNLKVQAASSLTVEYGLRPRRRGLMQFGQAWVRIHGMLGALEFLHRLGDAQSIKVFPNFAAVSRYAWLDNDRRLGQIGIKSYHQRGSGTDFKQLADYTPGSSVQDIDWRASQRCGKPIVREYQDERNQRVVFLLDCGRRMRADEGAADVAGSHFDQSLNALMLMSHVALKAGDEVGVVTFANHGDGRRLAPRKGAASLNGLIARLYDLEPSDSQPDYLEAARELMRFQRKRALVILLTNFRDEDASELKSALSLMRSRHLVVVASLKEKTLREVASQPITGPDDMLEIATAHWFEQSRRQAFRTAVGRDALSLDTEPEGLAVALVNCYHAVKKSGVL